ncbi:MAG: sulfatase-like hydrolase/transferase [Planctomycetales bacterium]
MTSVTTTHTTEGPEAALQRLVRKTQRKNLLWGLLHLVVLYNFAVAQPLYDRLSRRPIFFETTEMTVGGLLILVALLSLLLPAFLVALELVASYSLPIVRRRVHRLLMSLLWMAFAFVICQSLSAYMLSITQVAIAMALGGGFIAVSIYYPAVYSLLTAASPGIVIFPGLFLLQGLWLSPILDPPDPPQRPLVVGNPTPIVMIVFDSFSGLSIRDEGEGIDARRCPNIAKFAKTATWYRNTTAVHPRTDMALPAILTGQFPRGVKRPTLESYPFNLFSLLFNSQAFRMTVFEPYTTLYPGQKEREQRPSPSLANQTAEILSSLPLIYLHTAVPRSLPLDLPPLPGEWFGITNESLAPRDKLEGLLRYNWFMKRQEQMDHFLASIKGSGNGKNPFYFLHIAMPHFPWCYLPSGQRYLDDRSLPDHPWGSLGDLREMWCGDPAAAEQGRLRYLLQLGAVDHYLGEVLAAVRREGLFDDALIIVTGDHGCSYLPSHSRRSIDAENLLDIAAVPLLIKYPHQTKGAINDDNVESIDIFPTIADLIQLPVPTPVDGRSLLHATYPVRPKKRIRTDDGKNEDLPANLISSLKETPARWHMRRKGAWPECDYPLGPHPELIGKKVDQVTMGSPSKYEMTMKEAVTTLRADPRAIAPGRIAGYIKNLPDPTGKGDFAIAVNKVVAMTAATLQADDYYGHFSCLIPLSRFQPGENEILLTKSRRRRTV